MTVEETYRDLICKFICCDVKIGSDLQLLSLSLPLHVDDGICGSRCIPSLVKNLADNAVGCYGPAGTVDGAGRIESGQQAPVNEYVVRKHSECYRKK